MGDKTTWNSLALPESDINTYLSHTGGAWNSYTPTLGGITLGNGTLVGKWFRAGRFIKFKVKLTFGSTTSVSGAMTIGLPVAYADGTDAEVFAALLYDASANQRYPAKSQAITTSTVSINAINAAGTYLVEAATSSTVPFTWTTSDILIVSGTYESAS